MNRWVWFWSLASLIMVIDPSNGFQGWTAAVSHVLGLFFALQAAMLWKDRP